MTMYDDRPVPKVIDFGVAKAIEQRLTERTLFTQFGALVGTFEYMSPEQAEMNAFGVDTRSDIYSLGVLLYELLTGTTPLERQRLREAALGEMVRLIKEEEPPRPSVRLSGSGDLPEDRGAAEDRAGAAVEAGAGRGRLDRDEVPGEGPDAAVRDGQRRWPGTSSGTCTTSRSRRARRRPATGCGSSLRKHRTPMALAACFALLLLAGGRREHLAGGRGRGRAEREPWQRQTVAAEAAQRPRPLEAERRQVEAETARQSLRRSLYASDMQLAEEAWESGDILRMRELLDGQKPRAGEDDLRGFEWHYLRRLGSTVQMSSAGPWTRLRDSSVPMGRITSTWGGSWRREGRRRARRSS